MDKIDFILENLNINLSEEELLEFKKKFTSENISYININFDKYKDLILILKNFDTKLSQINQQYNSSIIYELSKNISKLQILIFIYMSSKQFNIPEYDDIISTLNSIDLNLFKQYDSFDQSLKSEIKLLFENILSNFKILQNNIIIKNNNSDTSIRNRLLNFIISNRRFPSGKGKLPISQQEFEQILSQIKNDLDRLDKQLCIRKRNYCNQYKGDRCATDSNCVYNNFICQPKELQCRNNLSIEESKVVLKEKAEKLLLKIKYFQKYLIYKNKYLISKK